MKKYKVRVLGIASQDMLFIAQKVAPTNTSVITADRNDPAELRAKLKGTDAILLMPGNGGSDVNNLRKANLEGKPVAVLKLSARGGNSSTEENLREVMGALTKWAIHLRKN